MLARIEKLRAVFPDADAVLVTSPVNRFWLSGFETSAGAIIITGNTAHFIADSRYIEAVTKNVTSMTAVPMLDPVEKEVACLLGKLGCRRVAYEDESMTVAQLHRFEKAMPEVELLPAGGLVAGLRVVKDEGEIALVKKAQSITEAAYEELLGFIRKGRTELEVARRLEILMIENGAQGMAFDIICVSGPNSSMPHGVPGERALADGDFVTMDFGAAFGGYCSDMTRTIAIGHATEEMRHVYDVVLRAQLAAIESVKAGVTGRDIDKISRDIITEAGYGDNFGHGLGHSYGIEIHESPRFSKLCDDTIPEGCLITVEPGIYLPGKFGVRIEDDILVTEDGCVNLTASPKELLIL